LRVWQAMLLLNLALVMGAGWGYAWWGRRAAVLEQELGAERGRTGELERELAALRATRGAAAPGVQRWDVRGVVRAVLPEMQLIVITHEAIPGFMAPMTMGFREASPALHQGLRAGDAVRFTVEGIPPNVLITAIEKTS